jgi:hypothetical protein
LLRVLAALLALITPLISTPLATSHRQRFALATDERILRLATILGNRHHNPLPWLHRQPVVRDAELGPDGRTITIHLRDGLTEVILPPVAYSSSAIDHPQRIVIPPRGATFQGLGQTMTAESATPTDAANRETALVLAPFVWEYGAFSTADQVTDLLHNAGYATTELINNNVTVAAMKTLASYAVVYITGHSGWLNDGTIVVSTGEQAFPGDNRYTADLNDGNLVVGSVAGDAQVHLFYDITPQFVKTYLGRFAPNSFMLINGCGTTYSSTLWQALQAKGLAVYVGWTNEVFSPDMERGGYTVMKNLVQAHMSVGAAVQSAVQSGAGQSETQTPPSTITIDGDSTLTLNPYPIPTNTPTPIPTSTPPPTMAPARQAPLSSLDFHKLTAHASPHQIRVDRTTSISTTVTINSVPIPHIRVVLDGRAVKAGFHSQYTNRQGVARFREHPWKVGLIHGWVDRPHLKPWKFIIHVVK